MITVTLPFDATNPDLKARLETAQQAHFQADRPMTEEDFLRFVKDMADDNMERLTYNIGFLLGLYVSA